MLLLNFAISLSLKKIYLKNNPKPIVTARSFLYRFLHISSARVKIFENICYFYIRPNFDRERKYSLQQTTKTYQLKARHFPPPPDAHFPPKIALTQLNY